MGGEAQFALGEAGSIIPYVVYGWSEDSSEFFDDDELDKASIFWLGLDADFTLGTFGLWFSGGYVGGKIDATGASGNSDTDLSGFVLAGGGSVPLGPASIHAQGFYASGDDDLTDDDRDGWFGLSESYYWSEIMGLGIFDNQASAGSPGGGVSNIWAAQLGATIKPFDKLSITGDLWYAALVEKEESLTDKKPLGFEVDLILTYQLVEGMNLDLVGAYLFADDATSNTIDKNDKDPWEIGWRTSLSF